MTDTTSRVPTVRFAGLPRRGLLLGLSGIRVACLAIAIATMVGGLVTAGQAGLAETAPAWVAFAALTFGRWQERPAAEALLTAAHFLARRAMRQSRFRARIDRPRPVGTLALPGDAASLRFHLDPTTGAAMVHDPHAHTLTAVAHVSHPAYVLMSADEQARRVHGWGRALASLAATGTGTRIQVLETTLPDAGAGITSWWETQGARDGGWAAEQYEELMRTVVPATATHRTLVAVGLDLRRARTHLWQAGRGIAAAAGFLRQEMTAFEAGLRAADLTMTGWLDEPGLAGVLRTAYDPAHEPDGMAGQLATAGPVAVDEHWDHLRHDTGHSAVLWVSQWPRTEAPTFFLHALVFQPGVRKTISLTLEPLPVEQAMRDIRKAKVEYVTDAAQKARLGALADAADAQEHSDVLERERALLAGHADVRLTGLITITAADRDALEAAVAEVSRAAIHCGCETRRVHGRQARAFAAAALPLARRVS
ncbi:SCO6880 family protein [Pedococcus sp. NPDC057267]|uniref:SCO6880 family protein n=1 Tax=Pedococcus sp. NPDC057267 TaxID=3346077 RepID=UPI0036303FF7